MKKYTYGNNSIKVTFDESKCCHATHCFKELPHVFDGDFDPPIRPDNSTVEDIVRVVELCPSSALTYIRLDQANAEEQPPTANTAMLLSRGPLMMRGNFEFTDHGTMSRIALCRCGESKNKPFCDASHRQIKFNGPAQAVTDKTDNHPVSGRVTLTPLKDGPILFSGDLSFKKSNGEISYCRNKGALCRCGASNNKPFCDGAHNGINFNTN